MSVLVTGGGGFIGSKIVEKLLSKGMEVKVLDDFSTGRKTNLEGLNVELIEGDIRDRETAERAVRGVQCVFHEAAIPSVPRSVKDPISSNDVNVGGTLNMLVAAHEAGVKKFIYAGSSSAYGETETLPKVETIKPAPISPYAVSKLAGEHYCQAFHSIHGMETVVLRYFNVFGPNQNPKSQYAAVIPKFIISMLEGKGPKIYGDGEQTRDFTYVEDVVSANILAMENSKMAAGKIMNISKGDSISVNALVSVLNDLLGTDIKPEYLSERAGDIKHSFADIKLSKELISFEPKFSLKDGLEKTIEHLRK